MYALSFVLSILNFIFLENVSQAQVTDSQSISNYELKINLDKRDPKLSPFLKPGDQVAYMSVIGGDIPVVEIPSDTVRDIRNINVHGKFYYTPGESSLGVKAVNCTIVEPCYGRLAIGQVESELSNLAPVYLHIARDIDEDGILDDSIRVMVGRTSKIKDNNFVRFYNQPGDFSEASIST